MKIIKHRLNTINQIKECPIHLGAEIDIRTKDNKLILQHDPFLDGEDFDIWIKHFNHKFLIINVKEDGLESEIIKRLKFYKIKDYFFLDQPFPTFKKSIEFGYSTSLRISEYELNKRCHNLPKYPEYIWMDIFNIFDLKQFDLDFIKQTTAKICMVSPELQGRDSEEIKIIKKDLSDNKIKIWGVCTKWPELWM